MMCTFLKLRFPNLTCIGTSSTQQSRDLPLSNKGYFLHLETKTPPFFFLSCNTQLAHFCDIHKHHQVSFKTTLVIMSFPPERLSKTCFPSMCYLLFAQNSNIFDCLGITSLSFSMFATSLQLMSNSKFYLHNISSVWPIN